MSPIKIPLILLIVFSIIAAPCSAQDSTFKITSFIPERFQDLELKLDGEYSLRNNDEHEYPTTRDITNDYDSFMGSGAQDFNLRPSLTYNFWTRNTALTYYSDLQLTFNYSDMSDSINGIWRSDSIFNNSGNDNNEIYVAFYQSLDYNRYFYKDYFLNFQGSLDLSYDDSRYKYRIAYFRQFDYEDNYIISDEHSSYKRYTNTKIYSLGLSSGLGKGRVYNGKYASAALYIIRELKRNALLTKEPNYKQMLGLAEIIYLKKEKHVIDSRIRRIETVEAIIDFLLREGIIEQTGIRCPMYINDVIDYFPKNERLFGTKFGCGLKFNFSFGRTRKHIYSDTTRTRSEYDLLGNLINETNDISSLKNKIYSESTDYAMSAFVDMEINKAYSLIWQGRYFLGAEYIFDNRSRDETWDNQYTGSDKRETEYDYKVDGYAGGSWVFILDSRSKIRIETYHDVTAYRINYFRFGNGIKRKTDDQTFLGAQSLYYLNYTYRISIPTTLTIGFFYTGNYIFKNDYYDVATINGNLTISIGISHHLF